MSEYRPDSVYKQTEIIDRKYLDVLQDTIGDIESYKTTVITIGSKFENKPDLLANQLYGNSRYWWVFAVFNQDKLEDPILDFKSGLEITVPEKFN